MNAHPSTPTQIATTGRARAIVILFAGLLVLAAAIVGSVFVLGQGTPAATITARGQTNHLLIAHCRPCQDEALAAGQGAGLAREQAAPSIVIGAPPRALTTNCRPCRDEALAGTQASFGMVDGGTIFSQLDDPHQSGPR
jgi:hypothetical protein